jgi:excisionase family DNA binding protein
MTDRKLAYSLKEGGLQIGVSTRRIYQLIKEEKIPAIKLGKRTLVRHEALQNYLDSLPSTARGLSLREPSALVQTNAPARTKAA